MKLLSIVGTDFDNLKRLVIKAWNGKSRTLTAEEVGPYGTDSNPVKDTVAVYVSTEVNGAEAFIGCLNKNRKAEPGEHRIFSTDAGGDFKFNIWLKADDTVLIGDSDVPADYANFAVLFNELKTEFNALKADYNDLVTKVNANATLLGTHTHIVTGAIPAAAPAPVVAGPSGIAGQTGSPNTSNIDNAKNPKVKFNP